MTSCGFTRANGYQLVLAYICAICPFCPAILVIAFHSYLDTLSLGLVSHLCSLPHDLPILGGLCQTSLRC